MYNLNYVKFFGGSHLIKFLIDGIKIWYFNIMLLIHFKNETEKKNWKLLDFLSALKFKLEL